MNEREKIIIVGAGTIGATLAKHLDNYDVEFVMPKKEVAVSSLMPRLVMPIENIILPEPHRQPLTRQQRRAQERKQLKTL